MWPGIMKTITTNEAMASEALKAFFGIAPDQIRRDLVSTAHDPTPHRVDERKFRESFKGSSCDLGASFHRRLLLAARMGRVSKLPSDLILFAVTVTVHEIAELACTASSGRGQLGEICKLTEQHGDLDDLSEERGDAQSSDQLISRIHDSVFLEVLKRYGLERYAIVYERNRALYEVRFEVGRRLACRDSFDPRQTPNPVERFREEYGLPIAQEFLRRLLRHNLVISS